MAEGGYRGISIEHGDIRFGNKEAKLLKQMKGQFPPHFEKKVDMTKVSVEVMRPWVQEKVTELLGFEDDVVIEYAMGLLEDKDNRFPDPRKIQISLTGFLESSTPTFVSELWKLLLSAQESVGGIPKEFVERKKEELRAAREKDARAIVRGGAAPGGTNGGSSNAARGSRWDGGRGALPQRPGFDASRGGQRDDRGGPRGGGGGGGGGRLPPGTFKDKSGNVTERSQDRGWGARGPASATAAPYDEDRDRGPRERYDSRDGGRGDRWEARDDPYYRPPPPGGYRDDPYYQPPSRNDPYHRSDDDRRGGYGRRGYDDEEDRYGATRMRDGGRRRYSHSASPPPRTRHASGGGEGRGAREESRTPPMRRGAEEGSRRGARDDTPPMGKRKDDGRSRSRRHTRSRSRSLMSRSSSRSSRSRDHSPASRSITPPMRRRTTGKRDSRSPLPTFATSGRRQRERHVDDGEQEEQPARTLPRKKSRWDNDGKESGEKTLDDDDAQAGRRDRERELRERVRESQSRRSE